MAKVELIVPFEAASGKAQQLQREMIGMLAPTQAEPGNEFYRLYASETEGTFFFHELWKSQEDLDQHLKSPHFQNFEKAIQNLVAAPLKIHKVTELG